MEQTLPQLLDRKNKRNELYDRVQESNNKVIKGQQNKRNGLYDGVQQNIDKAIKGQQNKINELYNEMQTESSKNNKITAKEDVKILEEATVRSSIRKCESWLQKYF